MYAEYLSFMGYRVLTAANGLAGLDLALAHRPDVVVLDLTMPGMDGWEVCRRLKSQPAPPRVIVKPCLPDDLLAEIENRLRTRAA